MQPNVIVSMTLVMLVTVSMVLLCCGDEFKRHLVLLPRIASPATTVVVTPLCQREL